VTKAPASKASPSKPGTKAGTAKTGTKAAAGSKGAAKDAAGREAKAEQQEQARAQEPELTEEERAACVQKAMADALEATKDARQAAWAAQVEADRRKEVARRKKAEEEARRRKEEAALRKALLEGAYDGEDGEVAALLAKGEAGGLLRDIVDCADPHGNTLLSEAAAGGHESTVAMLLAKGANPNSQGEFGRTPLWRAAFLGHEAAVRAMLAGGGDLRIANSAGETPVHVASQPGIKALLAEWDTGRTDALVAQWSAQQEQRRASAMAAARAAVKGAEGEAEAATQDAARTQAALKHARQELEKRIFEHDLCVEEKKPDELLTATLDAIKAAEAVVAAAQAAASAAADRLDLAKLRLREQQAAEREAQGANTGGEEGCEEELPGAPVDIRDLDDVLVRDVGGKLAASGKWPLVIDTSGQASVFLRYLDVNYVNALSSHNTDPNRLRRSILGGLRYGKPVVLDLMDVSGLWPELPAVFDRVQPGLLAALLNKSILQGGAYTSLIRAEDGEEYDANKFQDARVARFSLIIHTSAPRPHPDLLAATTPLRVMVKA